MSPLILQSVLIGMVLGIVYGYITYFERMRAFRRYLEEKQRAPETGEKKPFQRLTFPAVMRNIALVSIVTALLYAKMVMPLVLAGVFIVSFMGTIYFLTRRGV